MLSIALPNPLRDRTLYELARAAHRLSRKLDQVAKRTPEERRQLVAETRSLLDAVAQMLGVGTTRTIPGDPECGFSVDASSFEGVYGKWFAKEVDALRVHTAERATRLAHGRCELGYGMAEWIREQAGGSDEKFMGYLRQLDVLHGRYRIRMPEVL